MFATLCNMCNKIKFMFAAWKLKVKNVTNEHRINGGNFFDIKNAIHEPALTNMKWV